MLESIETYLRGLSRGAFGLWGVAVELLLIGGVIYAALRFLQGTRGARLLKSLGFILVSSFLVMRLIAERLHLERIVFLYPYFVGGLVLVTIVAFQPEIRRGLLRLGSARWLRIWSKSNDPIIEPLVTVAERLSQKKIGALIAIQGSVGLDALAETGVALDAEVSAELLETIFYPGTVLHDLGVLIQNSRIAAAACQFPVAESGELALTMGSRHRAALGLSQDSDALIIVVSEETGTISVVEHDVFQRGLTPDQLRDLLTARLTSDRKVEPDETSDDVVATGPEKNVDERRVAATSAHVGTTPTLEP